MVFTSFWSIVCLLPSFQFLIGSHRYHLLMLMMGFSTMRFAKPISSTIMMGVSVSKVTVMGTWIVFFLIWAFLLDRSLRIIRMHFHGLSILSLFYLCLLFLSGIHIFSFYWLKWELFLFSGLLQSDFLLRLQKTFFL